MLAALTACDRNGGTADPSSAAMTDDQIMAIANELTQCMRDHGVTGFPASPWVVENGKLSGGGSPADAGVDRATVEAADQACDPIRNRLPEGVWADGPRVTAEDLEKMGRFSECLRQHGIPDWPDPDSRGVFPIEGTPLETALKTDQGQDARRACQHHYDGPIRLSKTSGTK
jgi:hypothetical protein